MPVKRQKNLKLQFGIVGQILRLAQYFRSYLVPAGNFGQQPENFEI